MSKPIRVSLLNMTCEDATRLASDSLDRQLTGYERWALRMHLWLCYACRRCRRQFELLHQLIANASAAWTTHWQNHSAVLSPERGAQIKRLLAEARRKEPRG
ncbi:MAG: zf-HC2 domain-containing protein [Pirellulales bacterium]